MSALLFLNKFKGINSCLLNKFHFEPVCASLGNIDISGLMDAFPALHTSHQRGVNGGVEDRGEGNWRLCCLFPHVLCSVSYLTFTCCSLDKLKQGSCYIRFLNVELNPSAPPS